MSKFAVVTGSSSGIGEVLVRLLLERGWEVLGMARRAASISHQAYRHVQLDLADLQAVQAYFTGDFAKEPALKTAAQVSLINNAGLLGPVGPLNTGTLEEMARSYTVNAVVPQWLMGQMLNLRPAGQMSLVNLSSGAANNPIAGWGTYCSSKAALLMAGQVLAEDMGQVGPLAARKENLAIISYSPGTVDTPMQGEIRETTADEFPLVAHFQGLKEKGELADPNWPAGEICDLIERKDLPLYSELRRADKP